MADQALNNDTKTIFDDTPTSASQATATDDNQVVEPKAAPLPIPEELQDFIGEGKKYSSLEDALKSIPHAQKHISTLEQENKTYKEQIEKVQSMEELLTQMKAQQNTKEEHTTPPVDNDSADDLLGKLSQQMEALVEQKLALKQQQEISNKNKESVANAFKQAYGDKAQEVYTKLSQDTGVSIDDLNQLAAASPKALLRLAGIEGSKQLANQKVSGTINTEAFIANATGKPAEVKPVMYGATSADILATWRASKPV